MWSGRGQAEGAVCLLEQQSAWASSPHREQAQHQPTRRSGANNTAIVSLTLSASARVMSSYVMSPMSLCDLVYFQYIKGTALFFMNLFIFSCR